MRILILTAIFIASLFGGAIAAPPNRIISLTPSTTELLFALGLEDRIVGVTNACDYPAAAKKKPRIGSMVTPSIETIMSMKPDLVVASSDSVSQQLIGRLNGLGIKTYVISGYRLAQFPQALREFGAAVGRQKQADRMADKFERDITALRHSATRNGKQRSVLYLIWPDPPMAAGAATPIHEALEVLGLQNAGICSPAYYPVCSLEDIIRRAPDVIVIGSAHADIREQSMVLMQHLQMLQAMRNGRVYYVSDRLYRLGPRFTDGLTELKEIMK
jgi:iron complex transport system substrate-binding protein